MLKKRVSELSQILLMAGRGWVFFFKVWRDFFSLKFEEVGRLTNRASSGLDTNHPVTLSRFVGFLYRIF